jgi:hypothetical protein
MRLEDFPKDLRDAVEMAGWTAADAFLSTLEQRLPLCEWGGYQPEIGPLVAGILRNVRSALTGGAIKGETDDDERTRIQS